MLAGFIGFVEIGASACLDVAPTERSRARFTNSVEKNASAAATDTALSWVVRFTGARGAAAVAMLSDLVPTSGEDGAFSSKPTFEAGAGASRFVVCSEAASDPSRIKVSLGAIRFSSGSTSQRRRRFIERGFQDEMTVLMCFVIAGCMYEIGFDRRRGESNAT
ncbi:MAG TPA: hypothetical protein VJ783_00450 [Pirellulales bacterium]|nr:hypothetical protein [Pirellulales bacterium]